MRQKDIRTRVAEVEAEAKGLEGVEAKEEDEKSPDKKTAIIIAVVMTLIGVYIGLGLLFPMD